MVTGEFRKLVQFPDLSVTGGLAEREKRRPDVDRRFSNLWHCRISLVNKGAPFTSNTSASSTPVPSSTPPNTLEKVFFAQKGVRIYEKQEMMEKRRVLTYEFSNSSWRNGKLLPHYRKTSDLLAVTIAEHQKKMTTSRLKSSHFENWLPGRDSLRLRSG